MFHPGVGHHFIGLQVRLCYRLGVRAPVARGPSTAVRQARLPSAVARQARWLSAEARQARGASAAARVLLGGYKNFQN